MPGQSVQRVLDPVGIAERSRLAAQRGNISLAEGIAFEAAMDVGAGNASIARDRTIGNGIDQGERTGTVVAAGAPEMDLIAGNRCAGRNMDGADPLQRLVGLESRLDIEQAETVDRFRLALETLPVMDAPAEHLITTAQAKHPAAAPQVGADVRI